jgi:uncharacterized coiled-coil DUF342 family protein
MSGERLDYLDDERKKLWGEVENLKALRNDIANLSASVTALKEAVSKKTSDYEADAQSAARSAAIHKGRAAKVSEDAQEIKSKIEGLFVQAEEQKGGIETIASQCAAVTEMHNKVQASFSDINTHIANISAKLAEIDTSLEHAGENLEVAEETKTSLVKIESDIQTLNERVDSAHTQVAKKSREIAKLHDEIFGYTYEDEATKETQTVNGLKKELDTAYEKLRLDIG